MWVRFEVHNRSEDFLGCLPGEPIVIGEYEEYPLRFTLLSDQTVGTLALQIGNQWLERNGKVFYFGTKNENERGRRGDILIRIYHHDQHVATGHIIVTGTNLSETQYRYLIRDLRRLITLASADETDVSGIKVEPELQFITFYDRQLNKIRKYLDNLKVRLAAIEQAPQRTVVKRYRLEVEERARRVDVRTIRWRAIHGAQKHGRIQTYTNVESYNVYENQFIVYALNRLQQYLASLTDRFAHAVDQKIEELSLCIRDWESYGEIEGEEGIEERRAIKIRQIKNLRSVKAQLKAIKREKVPRYQSDTDTFLRQIDELLRLPFLTEVRHSPTFTLEPTLVLLRNPAYNAVYKGYQAIQKELQLDEQQRIENLLERVPIERTSKLYEYWVFLQIYMELKRMGFADADDSQGIRGIIDENTFRLKPGAHLHLSGDPTVYADEEGRTVVARLHYEHRFGPDNNFCPDIFIEFTRGRTKTLILDAKYRDYDALGCPAYESDVNDTAYHKYKQLKQRTDKDELWIEVEGVDEIRNQVAASFIVHCHHDEEERFLDYGSAGKANEYGAIPLVPHETHFNPTNLKRLLKMFMRMHLRLFDICWSEAHERPVKAEYVPKLGDKFKWWEGEYHCSECGNRWWVNHCGHWCKGDRNNVPKITFSDPSDNFFEFDERLIMGDKRLLKCSTCNRPYRHSW